MANKKDLFDAFRGMMREILVMQRNGGTGVELARARGYADGYMRCLSEAGLATQEELLQWVSDVRTQTSGPALGEAVRLGPAWSG